MNPSTRLLTIALAWGVVASDPTGGTTPAHAKGPPKASRRSGSDRSGRASKEEDRVDALFVPWARKAMPGAAVLVIQDGKVVLKKGYGQANLEKGTAIGVNTSFRLASVTKQFTAMAIMILAEKGKLRYEDRLSHFFPQFPPYAQAITVEHLLHHTAGLPDYGPLYDREVARRGRRKGMVWEPTAKEMLNLLAREKKLLFEPGSRHEYSNSGYMVLGQIVENVSGQRYAEFVAEAIFRPLGMRQSVVYDERRPRIANLARSYSWIGGRYERFDYHPLNLLYGEDGVFTTIEDLARWDEGLRTEKLVKFASLKRAFTRGKLNSGENTPDGYGWGVEGDHVWHNGWWAGYRTYIIRYPSRLTVVVLANCEELNADSMAADVAKVYLSGGG